MIYGYDENRKYNERAQIESAFYSAYFSRLKTLSGDDLRKVLESKSGQSMDMTDEDMFEEAKKLVASFGR